MQPFVIRFVVHRPIERKGDLFVQPTFSDNPDLVVDAALLRGDGTSDGTDRTADFHNVEVVDQTGAQCFAAMKFADPMELPSIYHLSKVDEAKLLARRQIVLEVRIVKGGGTGQGFASVKKGEQCTEGWRHVHHGQDQ